jgi:hypothetical protein
MPADAIPLSEYQPGKESGLTRHILSLSASAFENPSIASAVTFRGTKYAIGQYVILKVDHWNSVYELGKILQCVLDSALGGERVKFVIRICTATENIPGVLTVKEEKELCLTSIGEIADYYPLKALKGRRSTLVLHHYISSCACSINFD